MNIHDSINKPRQVYATVTLNMVVITKIDLLAVKKTGEKRAIFHGRISSVVSSMNMDKT